MKPKIFPKQKMSRTPREDGERTTAKIIEAAGTLFAERGYAETTNRAIANLAGVSVTSINYHFGSREVLYETVIKRVSESMLDPAFFNWLEESSEPAWAKLGAFVEYISVCEEGDWQARLTARELLTPSSMWLEMSRERLIPKLNCILDILSEATGIPGDAQELEICLFNVLSPAVFILVSAQSCQTIRLPEEAFDVATVSENIKEFILAGVERVSENYRKKKGAGVSLSKS